MIYISQQPELFAPTLIHSDIPNELYHHGIKGQKWGVRRYQNPDGSLTDAGKKRYNKALNMEKELRLGFNPLSPYIKKGGLLGAASGVGIGTIGGSSIGSIGALSSAAITPTLAAVGGFYGGVLGMSIGAVAGASAFKKGRRFLNSVWESGVVKRPTRLTALQPSEKTIYVQTSDEQNRKYTSRGKVTYSL